MLGGFTEKGGAAALRGRGDTNDVTFTTLASISPSPSISAADPFAIAGVPIAKDAAILDLDLTEAATLGIAYQGQFANDARRMASTQSSKSGFDTSMGSRVVI